MPLIGQKTERHRSYPEDGQAERETADMAESVYKRAENQEQKEAARENRRPVLSANGLSSIATNRAISSGG
jgi:hypothetical protein